MNKRPKISVGVITYNQEATIRQTLDSILAQKGEFDLEVVIGEDKSPDGTAQILDEYVSLLKIEDWRLKNAPNVTCINVLHNEKNLGIMANTARVYRAASGDYISLIAGDDYYCDDHALEKQMQYMLDHTEVGVMGANGYQYFVRRNQKIAGFNPTVEAGEDKAKEFFFSPTYKGGIYLWPVGMMIRRDILQYIDFDEIIKRGIPVEDYPMQAIWSQHTRFACLPDLLVTYRVYSGSTSFISFDHPKYMEYYRGIAEIRRYLNDLFPDDACITEAQLQEQLFYKEFLLYLHRREYRKAKSLIANAPTSIADSPKLKHAKRFAKSWMHFIVAHIIKEILYKKEILQLT